MNIKTLLIGIGAITAFVLAFNVTRPDNITVSPAPVVVDSGERSYGAIAGPDVYGYFNVHGPLTSQEFTQGGGVLSFTATSTQSTRTLTQAELLVNNVINIVSTSSPALTLTLPATSTMTTLLTNAGDMREWFIDNQHLAATTTTIAAGAGIDLIAVTADDDVIDGQEVSRLTCVRKANTDVYCIVSELLKAD